MDKEFPSRPVAVAGYSGRIHSDFNTSPFLKKLASIDTLLDSPEARILLKGRNRVAAVSFPVSSGKTNEIIIKEFRLRGVNLLKTLILPSKAKKAWRGSVGLVQREIPTPFPVAYLEQKKGLMVEKCFFLSRKIPFFQEIRFLFRDLKGGALVNLLEHLAAFLRQIHRQGVLHRDLSDGNILVRREGSGYTFFLVDTNRIRFRKRVGLYSGIKSLVRLGIASHYQRFFLEKYRGNIGLSQTVWLWYKLGKNTFSAYLRVKKALGLKKLARKLGVQ
ncbi:MAG: lipopolysaccharide kinase InaA family protein [Acidobacteriota bacterium]